MAQLEELDDRMSNVLIPSHFEPRLKFLSRFYTAAAGDLEVACSLIQEHLDWRKEHKVDEIGQMNPEELLPPNVSPVQMSSFFPILERGVDKMGRPVLYVLASRIDTRAAVKLSSFSTVLKYQIWQRERSYARLNFAESPDLNPPYYLMVLDLKGSSLSQANSDFYSIMRKIVEIDQAHYPGRVAKMVLVNAPLFFSVIWGAIRGLLNSVTEKKISIVSSRQDDVRRALLMLISEAELPSDFGGRAQPLPIASECRDEDLFCPMLHRAIRKPISAPKPPPAETSLIRSVSTTSVASPTVMSPAPASPILPSPRSTQATLLHRPSRAYLDRLLARDETILDLSSELARAIQAIQLDMDTFERDALQIRMHLRQSAKPRARALPHGVDQLRLALDQAKLERDSHARAVAFAKNYIEVEVATHEEAEKRLRARLDRTLDENRGLTRAVEVVLGEQALKRVLAKIEKLPKPTSADFGSV